MQKSRFSYYANVVGFSSNNNTHLSLHFCAIRGVVCQKLHSASAHSRKKICRPSHHVPQLPLLLLFLSSVFPRSSRIASPSVSTPREKTRQYYAAPTAPVNLIYRRTAPRLVCSENSRDYFIVFASVWYCCGFLYTWSFWDIQCSLGLSIRLRLKWYFRLSIIFQCNSHWNAYQTIRRHNFSTSQLTNFIFIVV